MWVLAGIMLMATARRILELSPLVTTAASAGFLAWNWSRLNEDSELFNLNSFAEGNVLARALTQYRRAQRALRWVVRSVWPGQFKLVRDRVAGGVGLEVGGPSSVFRRWRAWPIYPVLTSLDLVNFSSSTVWRKDAARLTTALPPRILRRELTAEATDLGSLATGSYDVLLASHVIEHLANPLGALQEWRRVLRPGGVLFLVAPHRDGTFDHRRPVTPLAHLMDDFRQGTSEADRTHVDEVLRLHDLSRDPGAEDAQSFQDRTRRNAEFRAMHHHVFDTYTLLRTVDAAGATILYVDVQPPWHIAVAAEWTDPVRSPGNSPPLIARNANWLAPDAAWRRTSPFPSDHQVHPMSPARGAEGQCCWILYSGSLRASSTLWRRASVCSARW